MTKKMRKEETITNKTFLLLLPTSLDSDTNSLMDIPEEMAFRNIMYIIKLQYTSPVAYQISFHSTKHSLARLVLYCTG